MPTRIAYTVFQDSHGRLWAGTTRSPVLYRPEADAAAPRTILDPNNNLREVSPSGEARIAFSGINEWNRATPERLTFSCRLDGGAWSPFLERAAVTYRRLSGGAHGFQCVARTVNGNVDLEGKSLEFKVPLPWYRQFGFLMLLGLG